MSSHLTAMTKDRWHQKTICSALSLSLVSSAKRHLHGPPHATPNCARDVQKRERRTAHVRAREESRRYPPFWRVEEGSESRGAKPFKKRKKPFLSPLSLLSLLPPCASPLCCCRGARQQHKQQQHVSLPCAPREPADERWRRASEIAGEKNEKKDGGDDG